MAAHPDEGSKGQEGTSSRPPPIDMSAVTEHDDAYRGRSPTEKSPRQSNSLHHSNDDSSEDTEELERTNTYEASENMIGQQDRAELVRIATALSRRRSSVAVQQHPSIALEPIAEYDPELDPERGEFDLKKWLQRFVNQLQEQGFAERTTGVSFRDLDVYGSGSAIQIQQTVGSFLMSPLKLGEFFSFGKKEPKHILHSFDGLMDSGELLIVLGRPGSGCSTMLKTMCGELHGLNLGERSKVHYSGIPLLQMQKEFKGEAIYNQEVSRDSQLSKRKREKICMLTTKLPG